MFYLINEVVQDRCVCVCEECKYVTNTWVHLDNINDIVCRDNEPFLGSTHLKYSLHPQMFFSSIYYCVLVLSCKYISCFLHIKDLPCIGFVASRFCPCIGFVVYRLCRV